MGCSFSGLNALYDAVNGGGDVWINDNRFRILRQLGEGGFAYVYLVKEVVTDSSAVSGSEGLAKKVKDQSHLSGHNRKTQPLLSVLDTICDIFHVLLILLLI